MTIYWESEIPVVCKNEECPNFRGWEKADIDDIQKDEKGKEYVVCWYCKEKIYMDD